MNTVTQNRRRVRNNRIIAPMFETIINEVFNTPLQEVLKEKQTKFSYPAANIAQNEEGFIITMAIPGVSKENVSIKIEKNLLMVKSQMNDETKVNYRLREFNYTNFERSFKLSDDVNTDNISAKINNGILTIAIETVKDAGPVDVKIS